MPSSPPRRWADLAGARVGLWGLGAEGNASRRRLLSMGVTPVIVADHSDSPEVLALATGGLDALGQCEIVIKSPGVSRYRPEVKALEGAGVEIVGGLGLWLESVDRDRVICVTGTKGKSTTVAVAGHLASRLGLACFVGGNIGSPPFDPDAPDSVDLWVIEVSSFQATDLWSAPPVVGVTSLHADHLDWHGDEPHYVADKLSLCTKPGARTVVANGSDEGLRTHARQLGPQVEWIVDRGEAWVDRLGLRGRHNRTNAVIAAASLGAAGVVLEGLEEAAAGFTALPSRLTTVAVIDGVEFVDDSLSTNVLPTIAALEVFADRRVALLVGGFDRGIDYAPLAEQVAARHAPLFAVGLPESGPRITALLAERTAADVAVSDGLTEAVTRAYEWARPDGVVLLSPAAPSFGQFTDYRDRAHAFAAAVDGLR